ncbi:hypothetical protein [Roseibium sp.]|uniref:hypothetical protein n=1 Tax=Roseibium sp. TaxID=1936156 RepID=UPI003D0F8FC3
MVFSVIAVWLLVAAVPLWIFRWVLYSGLEPRERQIFRRIVKLRHERAVVFALRVFGYLLALAVVVFALVFGLRFFKHGTVGFGTFREMIRSRMYSGMHPLDQALDQYHYHQPLPIAVLTTILVLSIAFTLVAVALRDIVLIKRMKRKLARLER